MQHRVKTLVSTQFECSATWKTNVRLNGYLLLDLICSVSFSCSWWGRGATWRRSCGWRLSGRPGSTWAAWRRSGSCCWCDRSSTQTTVRRTSTSQESQFRSSVAPLTPACGCSFSTPIPRLRLSVNLSELARGEISLRIIRELNQCDWISCTYRGVCRLDRR